MIFPSCTAGDEVFLSSVLSTAHHILTGTKDDVFQQMLAFFSVNAKKMFAYNLTCDFRLLLDTSGPFFETETV